MNRIKNAKKQTIDGVLFLPGVFKADTERIADFFHDRLLHGSDPDTKLFDKIPMVFTDLNSWVKSTNLLCWNCRRSFKGRPWFEPQSIDPLHKGKAGEFISAVNLNRSEIKESSYCINVKGNFCSPNCVMRHILIFSKNMPDRNNKISMLLFVYEIFTGKSTKYIEPAPLITECLQYGGNLPDREYQKKIDDSNIITKSDGNAFMINCRNFFNKLEPDK